MKNFQLIQKYLNLTLSNEEISQFNKRLENDPGFKKEFYLQQLENNSLETLAVDKIKDEFRNLKPQENRSLKWKWLLFLLALLLITIYIINKGSESQKATITNDKTLSPLNSEDLQNIHNNQSDTLQIESDTVEVKQSVPISTDIADITGLDPNNEIQFIEIAAAHFNQQATERITRGTYNNDPNEELILVYDAYHQKKYKKVIRDVEKIEANHSNILEFHYLKTKSLFLIGQYPEAIKMYKYLIENGSKFLKDDYDYELLIAECAYLPNEKDVFKRHINKIRFDNNHTYQNEANNLYEALSDALSANQ